MKDVKKIIANGKKVLLVAKARRRGSPIDEVTESMNNAISEIEEAADIWRRGLDSGKFYFVNASIEKVEAKSRNRMGDPSSWIKKITDQLDSGIDEAEQAKRGLNILLKEGINKIGD